MKARRIILWVAVVGVAAAVVLLAGPLRGGFVAPGLAAGTGSPGINAAGGLDLTAPITSVSCVPCHLNVAEGKTPGLVFHHATHLSFQCVACHPSNPHLGGGSAVPTMRSCYNCHGIKHGPQGELATGQCRQCHTADFNLRPKDHTAGYAGKPHADQVKAAGAAGANQCMMCHSGPKDCDPCHQQQGVKVGPMPAVYQPVYTQPPPPPAVTVYPDQPTSMGQCVQCHPNIDKSPQNRVTFKHAEHTKRGYACTACHPTFAHQGDRIAKPTMQSCYRCHGLDHSGQGVVATGECAKCHPPGFDLKPANHTQQFAQQTHGARAEADGAYCAMCHKISFCTDCHTGKKKASWITSKDQLIPANHKNGTWQNRHGKDFIAGKGLCGACHDATFCTTCHKTPMPHPPNWAAQHNPASIGVPKTDCNICHTDTRQCQACHHNKVKNSALIAVNCVGCHPEMKQKPATAIKNKGFAEHAVHFDVYKTKGKPYQCNDCHVEIGTSAAANTLELQQGHDLRLCYSCHGGLDYQNRQIAPYPGAQLCRRCHQTLNI